MKHEAIYKLYSNVTMIEDNEDGTFKATDTNKNEVSIDMSAVNTRATELQTAEDNKETAKATAQAEATALTGYTPE